jgi:quercetin dioxygenase-like cupin family protein
MGGKFIFASETKFEALDWGRLGWLSSPSSTGAARLTVIDGILNPGKGHDFHKHPNQEELLFVVAGRVEQWIDQVKRVLGPGDSAFIPADTVHASFNIDENETKVLAILGPSVCDNGYEMVDVSGEAPWNRLRS